MRKYKLEIITAAVFLLLGICCIQSYRKHVDFRIFGFEELTVSDDLTVRTDNVYLTVDPEVSDRDKGIVETPAMFLEKGKYNFAVSYETDSDDNVVRIVSDTTQDADGNVGVVYAESALDPAQSRAALQVEFDQDVTNLHIRILAEEGSLTIREVVYRNLKKYTDPLVFYVLFVLLAVYMYCVWRYQKKSENSRIFDISGYILFLSFLATLPLMNDFLPWGHDLDFHLARIEGTARALRYGQFPVRLNPVQNSGYGYASPVMYPSLFIYIPAVLRLLGLSLMNCYKVLIFIVNLLTAVCSYISCKKVWKDHRIGMAGCALYMMGAYRITNLYIRASLGEALAMAFLPLIFWGIYEILYRDHNKWPVAALGFSFVMQSHVLSTEIYGIIVLPVVLISIFCIHDKLIRIGKLCLVGAVTVACNLWFLLPFLEYLVRGRFTVLESDIYMPDRTAYLSQVFGNFLSDCFGPSLPLGSTQGETPLSLGLSSLLGAAFLLYVLARYRNVIEKSEQLNRMRRMGLCIAGLASLNLAMSLWILPWDILISYEPLLKGLRTIQYMWRFLGPSLFLFCCAALSGIAIWTQIHSDNSMRLVSGVILGAIILGCPFMDIVLNASTYPGKEYVANSNYTDTLYYYDSDDIDCGKIRGNRVTFEDATGISCKNMIRMGSSLTADILTDADINGNYIELPLYYYPGYRAYLGGEEIVVESGEKGVVRVRIPHLDGGKQYRLSVRFEEPAGWKIADAVSVCSLTGCLCAGLLYLINRKGKKIGQKTA